VEIIKIILCLFAVFGFYAACIELKGMLRRVIGRSGVKSKSDRESE